jgi:NADPH:quinone reductase-like Zn-dependent oxidoreductase
VPKGAGEILGVEFSETVVHVGPASPEGEDGAEANVLRASIGRWNECDEVFRLMYGVRALPHLFSTLTDRLFCPHGAYAEDIVSPATHLIPKPAALSFVDTASSSKYGSPVRLACPPSCLRCPTHVCRVPGADC